MLSKCYTFGCGQGATKAMIQAIKEGVLDPNYCRIVNSTSKDIPKEYLNKAIVISEDPDAGCGKVREAAKVLMLQYIKDNPNAINDLIDETIDYAKNYLKNYLPMLRLVETDATYLLWIDCSSITDNSVEFTQFLLKETGLYLSDGLEYGEGGKTFVRMNIACPREYLKKGLTLLHQGINILITKKTNQ